MKFSLSDWRRLRREALLFLGILLAGGMIVVASLYLQRHTAQSLAAAREKLQGARNVIANIDSERAELTAGLAPYQTLLERSIVGQEERLQWRETLEAAQALHAIDKLNYSLSPRQPLPGTLPLAKGLRPYRSSMTLDLAFRREPDLVAFLEKIAEKAHALPIVRKCEVFRSPDAARPEQLAAQCQIDWITIERTNGGRGGAAS